MSRWVLRSLPVLVSLALLAGLLAYLLRQPGAWRLSYWFSQADLYFAPALLALALTPVVLTGGIDLSVGSVTVFASVVVGLLLSRYGWPLGPALLVGLLVGLLAGAINGLLVAVGVLPLVATLATRELFRGLALSLCGDTALSIPGEAAGDLWRWHPLGVPLSLWAVAFTLLLVLFLVHHTWPGRMLFALGDNATAAKYAGVPTRRLQVALYAFAGLIAGLCGLGLVLQYPSVRADAEKTLEMTAIACVVLGGIRIRGGAGHVLGTALGIATITLLLVALASAPPMARELLLGALLLGVALLGEAARRSAE
jgi:ribose/xylose/arabinose/galactoside ABC-type transport system permease subunit